MEQVLLVVLFVHILRFLFWFRRFLPRTISTNLPDSICTGHFGSKIYLSTALTYGKAHVLGPNYDGGKHQSRPKPEANFSIPLPYVIVW